MEVSFALRALRRFWLLVLLMTLQFGLVAFQLASQRTVLHEARTTVLFQPLTDDFGSSQKYIENQVSTLQSGRFLKGVADAVPGETVKSLRSRTTIDIVTGTDVADIKVVHTDPAAAESVARAYTTNLLVELKKQATGRNTQTLKVIRAQIENLDKELAGLERNRVTLGDPSTQSGRTRLGELTSRINNLDGERRALASKQQELELSNNLPVRTVVLQDPITERLPRRTSLITMLGLIGGFGLGWLGALLLAFGPRRVLAEGELIDLFGGSPAAQFRRKRYLAGPFWRAFKPMPIPLAGEVDRLCVRIESTATNAGDVVRVMVASPQAGSGSTSLAAAIAMRFAERGSMTILADFDLADPQLSKAWGTPGGSGLSELLSDDRDSSSRAGLLTTTSISDLRVLTLGDGPTTRRLLPRVDSDKVIADLSRLTEVLVIDGGSLQDLSTSVRYAQECDVVVLVMPEHEQELGSVTFVTRALRSHLSQVLAVTTRPARTGQIRRALGIRADAGRRN